MNPPDTKKVIEDLRALIHSAKTEAPMQAFLEKHPFLLTGFLRPAAGVVISQFPMGADFKADFAYVTTSFTGPTYLHLIEIERPNMRLFVCGDTFSQGFNHAYQQLEDWSSWCRANHSSIAHILDPLLYIRKNFAPRCRLIAGRRASASNIKRHRRLIARAEQAPGYFEVSTWDGFVEHLDEFPSLRLDQVTAIKCVKYKDQGYFEKEVRRMPE